jgi:hypothetical protein
MCSAMFREVSMSAASELDAVAQAAALVVRTAGRFALEVEYNGVRFALRIEPVQPKARKKDGDRTACKRDVLAVAAAAPGPLTRKQVVAALRAAGTPHPGGTVAKALADLTAGGELVNPRDRKGYRLPAAWQRSLTPDLFD